MPTELAKEFGRLAVLHGLISEEELDEAGRIQDQEQGKTSILTILVRMEMISPEQARTLLRLFYEEEHIVKDDHRIGGLILRLGWATTQAIREALKLQIKIQQLFPLRLGEVLVLQKVLTLDQINWLLDYQNKMNISCPCGMSFNLIKFNPGTTFRCYECQNFLSVPAPAPYGKKWPPPLLL